LKEEKHGYADTVIQKKNANSLSEFGGKYGEAHPRAQLRQ
jgi:hypothetical protein